MKELNKTNLRNEAVSEEECKESDEYQRVFVALKGDVVAKVTTL